VNNVTETSRAAFHSSQETITGLQLKALRLLREHGPATARELAAAGNVSLTIQKRLSELTDRGLAQREGARTCRVSGKAATVWAAATSSGSNPPISGAITSTLVPAPAASPPIETRETIAPDIQCGCGRRTAVGFCEFCERHFCNADGHRHECAP
jgi:hypothetical protein